MAYDVLKGSTPLPQITTEIHNITLFNEGFTLCFTHRLYTDLFTGGYEMQMRHQWQYRSRMLDQL